MLSDIKDKSRDWEGGEEREGEKRRRKKRNGEQGGDRNWLGGNSLQSSGMNSEYYKRD